MKNRPADFDAPPDAAERLGVEPVVCYDPATLPQPPLGLYAHLRAGATHAETIIVPPREARCFDVPAGSFFRISSVEGSQVGDLNLWAQPNGEGGNLDERFYSGKTRALHGTHLSTGDRMWSSFPAMRPMATIVADTLDWYGFDEFGGAVHDVIGTRCDPYTHHLLSGGDHYHHCCHSNLTRAVVEHTGLDIAVAQAQVHDVLNVFMCTGFMRDTGQYFMKASPVRPGDYIEFFAEIDLVGGLSACPGGNCADEHSSDAAQCHPLQVDVYLSDPEQLRDTRDAGRWQPAAPSGYDGSHGLGK